MLAVETWPVERVIPYPNNPRRISQAAIEKVAALIQEVGWRQPIVVDEEGVIIVGHTRLKAAQHMGLKNVPVHIAHGLTPEQAQAYRLGDNRTHEEASWDRELLNLELTALDAAGFDLKLTGFDALELPTITPDFAPLPEGDVKPLDKTNPIACPACGHEFHK